jgi:hypothetical protein
MKSVIVVRNFVAILFSLAVLVATPAARADESNQATKITFSQPVQIPGRVLPAGTYWFELPEDIGEHSLVRIYSADRSVLYATLLAPNSERATGTDHTVFGLAERGSAQPQAIVTWFYPGETTGHEFLYPRQVEKELASVKLVHVAAGK